jgi:hypothetical protein
MNHVIAASCTTGTWAQKWSCGWHQPPNQHLVNAGYTFGHSFLWVIVGAVIGLVIIMRGRGRRAAMAAPGRK